jgi:hypothetical protein
MTTIGIIGSGHVGSNLAQAAIAHGYDVVLSTRLGLAPRVNHWWSTTLYVTARGLSTSLMPGPDGGVEIEFDFCRHELTMTTTGGQLRRMALAPRTVADFYAEYRSHLDSLGIDVAINVHPNEIPGAIRFDEDDVHGQYDAEAMHPQLPGLGDDRGLQRRGVELRLLAGRGGRGHLLLLRLPGAHRLQRLPGRPRCGPLRQATRRVRAALR